MNLDHPKSMQVWLVLPALATHFLLIDLKDESKKVFFVEIQFADTHRQWFLLQFPLDCSISQTRRFIPILLHYFGIFFVIQALFLGRGSSSSESISSSRSCCSCRSSSDSFPLNSNGDLYNASHMSW